MDKEEDDYCQINFLFLIKVIKKLFLFYNLMLQNARSQQTETQ